MSTALRSVGLLDVLPSTPASPSPRAPCIHARLRRLATKPGEKSGLDTRDLYFRWWMSRLDNIGVSNHCSRYSRRSACIGSISAARRPGNSPASIATRVKNRAVSA